MMQQRYKVALIGASGLLGRAVGNELASMSGWDVVRTAYRNGDENTVTLNICDHESVRRFMTTHAPNGVVVAAAERRPDICENDPAIARALNVDALRFIASAAQAVDAWVLSISTDYVFDGTKPPYFPHDTPNPLNAYGRSKLEGEQVLLGSMPLAGVLRVPLLYGPVREWSESAVTSLTPAVIASAKDKNAPARMDAWAIRYPTFTPDVAVVIRQLLERHENGEALNGILHWSADEPMTKFEIAERIARALAVEPNLLPQFSSADATPRPQNCHLASSALDGLKIGQRTPFDTAIKRVLLAGM